MIKGYKAFRKGLIGQFNNKFEVGETYYLDGIVDWNKYGFHFCSYPEDTLRYMSSFNEEVIVCEVTSDGELVEHNDEYNGYYDMYVSNQITIVKELSREELFNLIVSRGSLSILRMIQTYKLSDDEIDTLRNINETINQYILYYQYNDYNAFIRKLHFPM